MEKFSDRTALSDINSNRLTYSEFNQSVRSVSNFLKGRGILHGDRVAILSENQVNWGVAYFAITTMGAVAVPIMTEFHSSEVHHILRHSGSKVIFVSEKYYDKIEEPEFDDLTSFILLDDFSIIPSNIKSDLLMELRMGGKKELAKIKAAALKLVGKIPGEVEEDDLASIIYTSGTTGHSKGVMLTHKNIVSDAVATTGVAYLNENDRLLSILPLFHTIESTLGLVTPLLIGTSVYYLNKPPTAAVLLPALQIVKPTVMLSVPLVTATDASATFFRACGKPLPGMQIKIDSPDPASGEGEVLIKGPNVMQGYFKDPERTNLRVSKIIEQTEPFEKTPTQKIKRYLYQ